MFFIYIISVIFSLWLAMMIRKLFGDYLHTKDGAKRRWDIYILLSSIIIWPFALGIFVIKTLIESMLYFAKDLKDMIKDIF